MAPFTYEQAVQHAANVANNRVNNPDDSSGSWAGYCQKFVHECVGVPPGTSTDPNYGGVKDARIYYLDAKAAGNVKTDSPPPPGSLAYYFKDATSSIPGHAVFVVSGGQVYSTPYGNPSPTHEQKYPGLARWDSFKYYQGYITKVPQGPLDIRANINPGNDGSGSSINQNQGKVSSAPVVPAAQIAADSKAAVSAALGISAPWVRNTAKIVYNPPMVRSAMHNEGYGPLGLTYAKNGEVAGSGAGAFGAVNGKTSPRLGRIIPEDWMPTSGFYPAGLRYGFRFLYNPTSYQEQIQYINGVDPSVAAQNLSNAIFSNSTFSFSLYLNRIEDMHYSSYGEASKAYPTTIGGKEWDGIKQFGTFWDLEYLFRTMNGAPKATWRGNTSEIGLLYSIPTKVYLGRGRRLRGRLDGVNLNHLMFNRDMIPTLTEVQLTFTRYVDTNQQVGESPNYLNPNNDGAAQANSSVVNGDTYAEAARAYFTQNPNNATAATVAPGAVTGGAGGSIHR